MLDNIRRKRSHISNAACESLLLKLYKFSPNVLKLNLGQSRLGKISNRSFRYLGQKSMLFSENCTVGHVSFKMLECPAGIFIMGREDQDNNPPRPKIIEKPFLLGETEVTQELYQAVMKKNPSEFKNDPQNPVERVSWVNAVLFCNELSKLQGLEACYSTRKVKIGILRSDTPSDEKEQTEYNWYYDLLYKYVQRKLTFRNPNSIEFEIEYDPDLGTCDVVLTDRNEDVVYAIEANWVEAMKDKYSLNLAPHLDKKHFLKYSLTNEAYNKLDEFFKNFQAPIFLCDFDKNGYRLPTEKEWEYAAKAGTSNRWSGTDTETELTKYAWFWGNKYSNFLNTNTQQTRPVKSKLPNEWGLYDMIGNVNEWCWDTYSSNAQAVLVERVARGGNWNTVLNYLGSAIRARTSECLGIGFRVCRSVVN